MEHALAVPASFGLIYLHQLPRLASACLTLHGAVLLRMRLEAKSMIIGELPC